MSIIRRHFSVTLFLFLVSNFPIAKLNGLGDVLTNDLKYDHVLKDHKRGKREILVEKTTATEGIEATLSNWAKKLSAMNPIHGPWFKENALGLTTGIVLSDVQARVGWGVAAALAVFFSFRHSWRNLAAGAVGIFFFSMDPVKLSVSAGGYWMLSGIVLISISFRRMGPLFYLGLIGVFLGAILYGGGGLVAAEDLKSGYPNFRMGAS